MSYDIFRPHTEPSATLYDAFKLEARKRNIQKDWVLKERQAVYSAAVAYAKKKGICPPSLQDVQEAENESLGSADYGAKWAIKVANIMLHKTAIRV